MGGETLEKILGGLVGDAEKANDAALDLSGRLRGYTNVEIDKALRGLEERLQTFKSINCANNDLHSIPLPIYRQGSLERLDLSGNSIERLETMCVWRSLSHLNLSHNKLHSVPTTLLTISPLRDLNLSNNNLTSMPFINPSIIDNLDVSHNSIQNLPTDLAQMGNLKTLLASHNKIESLSALHGTDERHLPNLETLDVSFNQLKEVPPELGKLQSLKKVALQGNEGLAADMVAASTEELRHMLSKQLEQMLAEREKIQKENESNSIFSGMMASIGTPGVNPGVIKAGYLIFGLLILFDLSLLVAMGPNIHVFIIAFLSCGVFGGLQMYLMELPQEYGGYGVNPTKADGPHEAKKEK